MSRFLLAVAAAVLVAGGASADNKENIEAAKAAAATLEASKDAKERTAAIGKLGALAQGGLYKYVEPAIPKVVEALDDKDAKVRAAAALAVGRIGPDDADAAIKKLAGLLKDEDDAVKLNAVKALGSFGPKAEGAVKELKAAKKANGDPKSAFSKAVDTSVKTIQPKKEK